MDTVVEIRIVGKLMNSGPLDWLPRTEAFPDWFQHRARRPYLPVAIHASLGGGDSGERRGFNGRMAITAIDSVVADMMFVTELNGLLSGNECLCRVGRTGHFPHYESNQPGYENGAKDRKPGNRISAAMKNLRHQESSNPVRVTVQHPFQTKIKIGQTSPVILLSTW